MKNAQLIAFKTTKVDFVNNIKENRKIELAFSYSYNVKYSDKNTCIGEFTASIKDKASATDFQIVITATGIFRFKEGAQKEHLHVETYNELFPHVRAFVSTLTATAGIPPIMIPFLDISDKEIYRFEMGKNGQTPPSADDFINPHNR